MRAYNIPFFRMLAALLVVLLSGCRSERLTCNYASADISTKEEEHVVLAGFAAGTDSRPGSTFR